MAYYVPNNCAHPVDFSPYYNYTTRQQTKNNNLKPDHYEYQNTYLLQFFLSYQRVSQLHHILRRLFTILKLHIFHRLFTILTYLSPNYYTSCTRLTCLTIIDFYIVPIKQWKYYVIKKLSIWE